MTRPPSVDSLARSLSDTGLPHPLLVDVAREAIAAGEHDDARKRAEALARTFLQPVVNATGVLLHTNMGRAPWAPPSAPSFSNLELDLATGERGSRHDHAARLMARLCEAEDAIIVNNCAAAVMLVLAALSPGEGVAVSRGELVEIGGGFRVPEVMEQSGSRLIEVGTTNRTRRADFERAVGDLGATMVMKIHQSNYKIVGFTEDVDVADMTGLGVPVVADIGSGLIDAACPWLKGGPPLWLENEPAAKQTLAQGANLVTFSGDKLLGGPQAGIIAGDRELVRKCARHPLARALRPGGLVLDALQQLVLIYMARDGQAIPFWRMASEPVGPLRTRAEAIANGHPVVDAASVPGGGTLPGVEIPSVAVAIEGDHRHALRTQAELPIMARVNEGTTFLDPRTIDPAHDHLVGDAIAGLDL